MLKIIYTQVHRFMYMYMYVVKTSTSRRHAEPTRERVRPRLREGESDVYVYIYVYATSADNLAQTPPNLLLLAHNFFIQTVPVLGHRKLLNTICVSCLELHSRTKTKKVSRYCSIQEERT